MILRRLDNVLPPLYDGENPEVGDPFIDSATAVRATTGDDQYHYSVDQRVQGDLMVRDLILLQNQQLILEEISLGGPCKVYIPDCVVAANSSQVVATVNPPSAIGVAYCRLQVRKLYQDLDDPTSYSIDLLNSLDEVLFTTTSAVVIPWVEVSAELPSTSPATTLRVVLRNAGSDAVTFGGSLVLAPKAS